MLRFYLRLALLPIILLTAVLLVIRSQPYDDYELRQLLLPTNCPAPCFMGIQPGVTTIDEAVKILEASGWVKRIERITNSSGEMDSINWEWNDTASTLLKRNIKNQLRPPYSATASPPLVEILDIETNIRAGDIYLSFGESYNTDSGLPGRTTENVAFVLAQYREHNFFISSQVYCPVSRERFLNSETTITWMTPQLISGMTGFSSIDFFC